MNRGSRRDMFVDLHLHTNESDGVLSPAQLVELVDRSGLERCAIVDHDTFGAYDRHAAALARLGPRLVRGIEISTQTDGVGIHLLGYGVASGPSPLRELLAGRSGARRERAHAIITRLSGLGVHVSAEEALGDDALRSVGRRQIAAAMVRARIVPDVQSAFDRYLGIGAPAYVPSTYVSTRDAIAAVRESGGVAVMAHPSRGGAARLVSALAAVGLQGIEVFYATHDANDIALFRELAARHRLVMTGGSDFHEPTPSRPTPGVSIAAADLEPFLRLVVRSA